MFNKKKKLEKRLRKLGVDYDDGEKCYTVNLPEQQEPDRDHLRDVVGYIASHFYERSNSEAKPIRAGDILLSGLWAMDIDIQVEGGSPDYVTQCVRDCEKDLDAKISAQDTPDNTLAAMADTYMIMRGALSRNYERPQQFTMKHTIEPMYDGNGNRVGEIERF